MEVIQILKENLNDQNKFLKEHNIVFRKYSKESSMILKIKGRDNDNEKENKKVYGTNFIVKNPNIIKDKLNLSEK